MEKTAQDYAQIFCAVDVEKNLKPISNITDDLLSRLDEFEALLTTVKMETQGIMDNHVRAILEFNVGFSALQERIDKLDVFTEAINTNLTALEQSVDIAEDELNVTDYSLKGLLLKPLLAKAKAETDSEGVQVARTNLRGNEFQPIPIFNANDFFDTNSAKSHDPSTSQIESS